MDTVFTVLLSILVGIFSYIVYQAWKINQFWKDRNIPHEKPWLFIGNSLPIVLMKKSPGERHHQICKQFPNEPVIGFYDFMAPTLLIKDVDMIEKILIKDFIHFVDHGFTVDEKRLPFESNLFTLNGKRWKAVRAKLAPAFTTGKLRYMFDTMSENGDELIKQLEKLNEAEMREMIGRFAMDVIGSCAFGIQPENQKNPNSEFRRIGKKAINTDFIQFLKFIMIMNFPSVLRLFKVTFNKKEVVQYFTGIIKNTVKHRRENGYVRNDFVQLMMQIQDKGYVEMQTKLDPDDDYLNIEPTNTKEKFELTTDQLTGQAFTFLTAGFEGTTITMMYTLYELCKHPEIQEKVRDEVLHEVKQNGSLSYDAIKEMTYLEQCIKEAMRKYPPAQMLFRICTKEYILPNGTKIDPGQKLLISVYSLNYNPEYFPEPDKYNPDRFGPDNSLPSCAFLAFGNGPRMCIAMRFAMLEIKYGLAKLLLNYKFKINPKTKEPLTINVKAFFTVPNETVLFDIEKLKAGE